MMVRFFTHGDGSGCAAVDYRALLLFENPPEVLVAQAIDGDVATFARHHALGRPFRRFSCIVPAFRDGAAERAFHPEWFVGACFRHIGPAWQQLEFEGRAQPFMARRSRTPLRPD